MCLHGGFRYAPPTLLDQRFKKVRIFPWCGAGVAGGCAIMAATGGKVEYTVVIRKAPDGFYIANCPLIPEARAQGETYEQCLANIKEVLELCLRYRKERGEEIPLEIDTQKVIISV